MNDQVPLFVEDYNEAIRAAVQALGGFKRVGSDLRPDIAVDAAGRWLADCINPDKREVLPPSALAFIRRRARENGCHVLAAFEALDAGYAPPVAIEPEDERAALMREFVQASKGFAGLLSRMDRAGLKAVA